MQNGKLQEAANIAQQLVKADPNNIAAQCLLGQVAMQAKDFRFAEARFQQVLKLEPTNALVHFDLAVVFMYQHDYESAIVAMRQTLKYMPNHASAIKELGNVLIHHGRSSEAIEVLRTGTEHYPKDGNYWLSLGNALGDIGRHEQAIDCYQHIISLNPNVAIPRSNILMMANYQQHRNPGKIFAMSKDAAKFYPKTTIHNGANKAQRSHGKIAHASHKPAEIEPGGRHDPRQES